MACICASTFFCFVLFI